VLTFTWAQTVAPRVPVSSFSTTPKMLATESSSSTDMSGKVATSKFVKTAMLALKAAVDSVVVADLVLAVVSAAAAADLEAVEASAGLVVGLVEGSVAVETSAAAAAEEEEEAMAVLLLVAASMLVLRRYLKLQTLSQTSLPPVENVDRLFTSAM
jgi:hypothetical protein